MARPVTLFTGQYADLPLEELAAKAKGWGYDGLELACWGDHFDVERGAKDPAYCAEKRALLARHGLNVWAISTHLSGQLILDPNDDSRSDAFAPAELAGNPEAKREWAIQRQKDAAVAAKNLGVSVVNGFTGSPIWHMIYQFPPTPDSLIEEGYQRFARAFNPILDVYSENGIKFALEVHPTEIAFDIYSTQRALRALNNRPEFGINFDPSHLIWQGVNPSKLVREFPDRIYHVHMKDAIVMLDGKSGILSSHMQFGDPNRGWDFRSLGHGSVDFEAIIRALNDVGYQGPLSVEWEDSGMDREDGATEAAAFVRRIDFRRPSRGFESAFGER
jgi:sugar phosphate isomerase/epimerase